MRRKVRPSIFISKRKCLINSKCYTKNSFSFTSPFISLKSTLFPLLFCSHSTLRNTTCTLYRSAHPQICLQPNIASPSLFKANILSLLLPPCSEDPTGGSGVLCRYLTAGRAALWSFVFRRETAAGWNVLDNGALSRMKPPGSRVSWGQRTQGSPGPTRDQPQGDQQAAGKDDAYQSTLVLQPVAVSAGKGWGGQGWQPPGCGWAVWVTRVRLRTNSWATSPLKNSLVFCCLLSMTTQDSSSAK